MATVPHDRNIGGKVKVENSVSERLEQVRSAAGVETLKAFHEALVKPLDEDDEFSVSYAAVRNYHTAERKPTLEYLVRVSMVFGVRAAWLMMGHGHMFEVATAPTVMTLNADTDFDMSVLEGTEHLGMDLLHNKLLLRAPGVGRRVSYPLRWMRSIQLALDMNVRRWLEVLGVEEKPTMVEMLELRPAMADYIVAFYHAQSLALDVALTHIRDEQSRLQKPREHAQRLRQRLQDAEVTLEAQRSQDPAGTAQETLDAQVALEAARSELIAFEAKATRSRNEEQRATQEED
jgi:hypothetical protein